MKDQEFSLREPVRRALARWWMVVIITTLGGAIGLIFHYFQPPIYEAKAVLMININFGNRRLTQYEEDHAFSAAGAIINSSEVKDLVIAEAQASGYSIDLNQLRQKISLERKQSVWELRVRDVDPNSAATLVNTWAEIAYQTLVQAQEHAIKAEQLQVQVSAWRACLPTYVTPTSKPNQKSPYSFVWNKDCEHYSIEEIENALAGLSAELAAEASRSQGLISILEFALTETATVQDSPVIYGQGNLVFAGAIAGFVIALWMASLKRQ